MNVTAGMGGMAFNSAQFPTPGGNRQNNGSAGGNNIINNNRLRERESASAMAGTASFWEEGQCEANDFFDQFVVLDDSGDVVSLNDTDNHSTGSSQHGGTCHTDSSSVEQAHSIKPEPSCSFDFMSMTTSSASLAVPATALPTTPRRSLPDTTQFNAAGNRQALAHPQGGGPMSESELLRFEELSMRSPRTVHPPGSGQGAAAASVPTSPTQTGTSRKQGRLENIYSTIRKAPAFFRRTARQEAEGAQPMPMSTAQMGPGKREQRPYNMGMDKGQQMPLSPPLTSPMPDLAFMNGLMDDPFMESGGSSMHSHHMKTAHTPLSTPLLDGTGAASWSMQNTPALQPGDDAALWNFVSGDNSWETTSNTSAQVGLNAKSANYNYGMHLQQNYDPHQQQQQLASSGLVIQMPQPPAPTSSLIQDPAHQLQHGLHPQYMPQAPYTQPYTEHRRKPRAPSSGARHHGAMTSPRKVRESSLCRSTSPTPATPSRPGRIRRSTSMQSVGVGGGAQSEAAVRKRRSLSRTRRRVSATTEPRTPGRTMSASFGAGSFESALEMEMELDGMGLPEAGITLSGSPRKNGGGQIGFVNFTPNDHNILMTGVAPSGSSKTKARREKEAAEKQRRLNEAVVKAVQAAGGDLQKLKEEGLVLGV